MIPDKNEHLIDESVKEEASAETLESIYQKLSDPQGLEKTLETQNRQNWDEITSDDATQLNPDDRKKTSFHQDLTSE
ncbi:hypothetical protein VUJ46_09305 [Chryseobacterium sp. MYb264]|uniref:hypothetical protein n=1 Tax=Chryseobacterium sp. MYb264 TaxID=2745153 RepID=UPI002E11BCDA|nr:hypothetical protein VUJ46_09305 [Chryseobacterium sp. MYb264]